MRKTTKTRVSKFAAIAAAPLAVLLAGGLVWQSSYAAFTATTQNAGNAWSTGSVAITDDAAGRAAFTEKNLVPGAGGKKCIVVTSGSDIAGEVRAYATNLKGSVQGLEDRIKISIERGTGGTFNDCTGFVADNGGIQTQSIRSLAAASSNYATGGARWNTNGTVGEKKVFRSSWVFDTTGLTQAQVNALQGANISVDIVWELQSADAPTKP